jgi:hypothetical protein
MIIFQVTFKRLSFFLDTGYRRSAHALIRRKGAYIYEAERDSHTQACDRHHEQTQHDEYGRAATWREENEGREERDHLQLYNRAVGITYSSTTARHFDSSGMEFRINSEQNGVRHVTDLVLHRHRLCRFQSLSEGQCRGVSKECLSVRYTSATHETTQHLNISTSQHLNELSNTRTHIHPHIHTSLTLEHIPTHT